MSTAPPALSANARSSAASTGELGAAGAIFGSKYNVLSALNLPRIPVHEGTLATGAAIALAAVVLGTLIAAVLGGRIGRRYHRKVDRVVSP